MTTDHKNEMQKLFKPTPPSSPSNSHTGIQIDGIPDSILPTNLQGALFSSSVLPSDLTVNESFCDDNYGNGDDVSMARNTQTHTERPFGEPKLLPYVKDGDKTVGKPLEENGAKMIGSTHITVGEGIEKKVDDFAAMPMLP
jgi:hypothetical protein